MLYRYWVFLLQARRRQHLENTDDQEYTFDAFVSYSYLDRHWVIYHLLPNIEYDAKMKLCIHQRLISTVYMVAFLMEQPFTPICPPCLKCDCNIFASISQVFEHPQTVHAIQPCAYYQ